VEAAGTTTADGTDRSECRHKILHEVLSQCEASWHRFSVNGPPPPKGGKTTDCSVFKKSLDAISRFAAKGCFPDDVCTRTRDVKKQINPSINAHLLWSALILLSLVTFNQDIFGQTPTPSPSPTSTACAIPTPGACTSYEAESSNNTLEGSAFVLSCPTCSGGLKVSYVGSNSGTLQFNGVGVVAPGNHTVTVCYLNGDAVRYAYLSVNGGPGTPVSFPSTGSFQTSGSIQITVTLNTGCNTLEFYNPIVGSWAPDFDRIQFNCPTCTVSAPSPTQCSILQDRLDRLQLRKQRLQQLGRSNKKLNKRIRRLRRQLQLQGCP
jgi:hypothetical protein